VLNRPKGGIRPGRAMVMAVAWALSLAASRGVVELSARANAPQQAPRVALPAPSAAVAPIVLEFELPDDFSRRDDDGAFAVTGFRIGYFAVRPSTVLAIVDVPRERVEVKDRTGRISLDFTRLPAGANQVIVRLQTVTRDGASPWSEASPPLRSAGGAPAPGPGVAGGPRRPRTLALADVQRHPRIVDALKQTLPSGATIDQVLPAFRRIEDLALAVVLCRDHQIVLTALIQKVQGPPRQSFLNAMRQLRPDSGPAVIRKARTDARRLLAPPAP
jgi:hypothetical protein